MEPERLTKGSWEVDVDFVGARGLLADGAVEREPVIGTEERDRKWERGRLVGRGEGGERAATWMKLDKSVVGFCKCVLAVTRRGHSSLSVALAVSRDTVTEASETMHSWLRNGARQKQRQARQ